MKRLVKKTTGLVKGAPTAVLLSAAIHLVLFFALGSMVVFTVVKKKMEAFKPPPPIERKKMDLKKPKVKVKKSVKPKSAARIVSKSSRGMTEFRMPKSTAVSEGLSGGIGGFELMPDLADMNLLGSEKSISVGNDFEGTFYALTVKRDGSLSTVTTFTKYWQVMEQFFNSGWNPNSLAMYYRWPKKLYSTSFFVPMSAAQIVPRSFGVPDEVNTRHWVVHYKGKFASKTGGKFRFWGRGDDMIAVRVNGKEVMHGGHIEVTQGATEWRSTAEEDRKHWCGQGPMGVGDWFELEPGVPAEMEVVFGDTEGWWTAAMLMIQEYGVEYPKNRDDGPILPVFKTAPIPQHLIDEMKYSIINGDADLTSDLIFNVH